MPLFCWSGVMFWFAALSRDTCVLISNPINLVPVEKQADNISTVACKKLHQLTNGTFIKMSLIIAPLVLRIVLDPLGLKLK